MQKMPQKQVTILAIEDNQDILGLIGRILGSEGYRVILAADGKFGIDLIRASEPD